MNIKRLILVLMMIVLTACLPQDDAKGSTTTSSGETQSQRQTTQVVATTEQTLQTTANQGDGADDAEYRNASFLEGVSNFVVTSDLKAVEYFGELEYQIVDDFKINTSTGQLKTFYYNSQIPQGAYLRVPQLTEQSELAKRINEEIVDLSFDFIEPEGLFFFKVDYDAFIYDQVLTLSLRQNVAYEGIFGGVNQILKTYHFDISEGTLKQLSAKEMLDRLNVSEDQLLAFASEYIPQYLVHFYGRGDAWNNLEGEISSALDAISFAIEEDYLKLYKNAENDYYGIEIDYDFFDDFGIPTRVHFTVADDAFTMALLSKPDNALGVIYKATEEQDMPTKNYYNAPIKLNRLNQKSEGMPVYITHFSEDQALIDISDLELIDVETQDDTVIFAEKTTSKGLPIVDDPDYAEVYLYYANLPETMPFEVVSMTGSYYDLYEVRGDEHLYDDVRFGSRMQYVYGTAIASRYIVNLKGEQYADLTFSLNGEFTASSSDDNWKTAGIPISKGRYTSDEQNYYLFPCREDVAAGADELYVFAKYETDENIYPLCGKSQGAIDSDWIMYLAILG